MKRVFAAVLCALLLAGCGGQRDPYRIDTVVRIPVDPTEAPTQAPGTEAPTEIPPTAAPTEVPETTAAASEPAETRQPEGKKQSGSTGKKKNTKPKETKPSATEAAGQTPAEVKETQPPTEAAAYDPGSYQAGKLERRILKEINARRAEEGLGELSMKNRLSGIAALRAEEAAAVWSHTRPDGRKFTSALKDYGYGFSTARELLVHVSGSGDAGAIVEKWMNSDSSADILSGKFKKAGVGIYRSGGVTYVAVLLVG